MGYHSPRTYTICGQHTTGLNPVDATTYYAGGNQPSIGLSAATRQTIIPKSGFIRVAKITVNSPTAAGTNEDWTWSLYDGTTTTAVQTLGSASIYRTWKNTGLNYRVTEGGYVQFITTTPTWATNPEGCIADYILVIEYE